MSARKQKSDDQNYDGDQKSFKNHEKVYEQTFRDYKVQKYGKGKKELSEQQKYQMYLKHKFEAQVEIRKYQLDLKYKQEKKTQTRHKLNKQEENKIVMMMEQNPKYTANQIKSLINTQCSMQKIQKFIKQHQQQEKQSKKQVRARRIKN